MSNILYSICVVSPHWKPNMFIGVLNSHVGERRGRYDVIIYQDSGPHFLIVLLGLHLGDFSLSVHVHSPVHLIFTQSTR